MEENLFDLLAFGKRVSTIMDNIASNNESSITGSRGSVDVFVALALDVLAEVRMIIKIPVKGFPLEGKRPWSVQRSRFHVHRHGKFTLEAIDVRSQLGAFDVTAKI